MRFTLNALKRLLGTGLVISLTATAPIALAADNSTTNDDEKPDIILYGEADAIVPDWTLATSGRVTVDGRLARLSDEAKHGSRILVGPESSARAEIKGVGRLTISPRSELTIDMIDDTIVANMSQGSMLVEVAAKYNSYVETADTRVVSKPGAIAVYRVRAEANGATSVDPSRGDVAVLPVAYDKNWDIDTISEDNDYHVDANDTRSLKIRVENSGSPVPNQPVTFAITQALNGASGGFTEGVQRITTSTDGDGMAEVDLSVGAASGTLYVEAFVPGTDAHKLMYVYVDAKEKTFWNPATTALYIALGAGAVAGTILTVKNKGGHDELNPTLTPQPPVIGKQ